GHFPDMREKDWEDVEEKFAMEFKTNLDAESLEDKWKELMKRGVNIDYFDEVFSWTEPNQQHSSSIAAVKTQLATSTTTPSKRKMTAMETSADAIATTDTISKRRALVLKLNLNRIPAPLPMKRAFVGPSDVPIPKPRGPGDLLELLKSPPTSLNPKPKLSPSPRLKNVGRSQ
ncbi:hypothetical protein RUND412_002978, partial [Rhizina undulata]